jgi:hypothetical protein
VPSFNVGHGPECLVLPHHVICHPRVEDLARVLSALLVTKLNEEFRLVDVNLC